MSPRRIKAVVHAELADGRVAMTCTWGHIGYVDETELEAATEPTTCPTCKIRGGPGNGTTRMTRSVSDHFSRTTGLRSNHHRTAAPPAAAMPVAVDGRSQCDACVVGDHGRCVGVGCFCFTSPATRPTHRAALGRTV